MSLDLLNSKAKFYTKKLWNVELDVPISINKRLKTTYGWYIDNEKIELSERILFNEYATDDILLHELCHWYCHKHGKKYKDNYSDFEKELEKIGSASTGYFAIGNNICLFKYWYGSYKCNICDREMKTRDYLEDKKEGSIGRDFKKYECCKINMKILGSSYVYEEYKPNDKILYLNKAFKNLK